MKKKIANAIQLGMILGIFVILKLPVIEAYHVSAIYPTPGHMATLSLISGYLTTYILYILTAIIVAMCVWYQLL